MFQVYGSGFTGMQNLGNSCYMASVMQTLFMIPEFQTRFYKQRDAILQQLVWSASDAMRGMRCHVFVLKCCGPSLQITCF